MTLLYYHLILASTYGSGTYNGNNYNGTNVSSGLTDTGIAVAAIVGLAAVILLVAMAVRIWKRPSKKSPPTDSGEDTTA